jgi:hypothetical protein
MLTQISDHHFNDCHRAVTAYQAFENETSRYMVLPPITVPIQQKLASIALVSQICSFRLLSVALIITVNGNAFHG